MDIVAAVIVHRHGTRFPSSTTRNNYLFPHSSDFWSKYGMMLTPAGCRQLSALGREFRDYFDNKLYESGVTAHSTDTSRTLFSCMAFLDGMFPEIPVHIVDSSDDLHTRKIAVGGITISIERWLKRARSNSYTKWRLDNILSSPTLRDLSERNDVVALLDKIFTMMMCESVCPSVSPVKRMCALIHFMTLVRYSESSNVPLMPNKLGISLTHQEIELLKVISDEVYAHHFTSQDGSIRIGKEYAGQLLNEIIKFLENGKGVRVYSVHDTTLLSLASTLGTRIQCPDFSGYFLFELFSDGTVGIKYNPSSLTIRLASLVSRRPSREFRYFDDLNEGTTSLSEIQDLIVGS